MNEDQDFKQERDAYDASAFQRFGVTVDLTVFTLRDDALHILLVRRRKWPYEDMWALPGGFVRAGEDANLERAALRELWEETSLGMHAFASGPQGHIHLEQLRAYWRQGRDPRPGLEVATVAFIAIGPDLPEPVAGADAAEAAWRPASDVLDERVALAFDHAEIVADAVAEVRRRVQDTPLATQFVPPYFTLAQLHRAYEAIWGRPLDKRNFYRKARTRGGFISPVGETTRTPGGRSAELWARGDEWDS